MEEFICQRRGMNLRIRRRFVCILQNGCSEIFKKAKKTPMSESCCSRCLPCDFIKTGLYHRHSKYLYMWLLVKDPLKLRKGGWEKFKMKRNIYQKIFYIIIFKKTLQSSQERICSWFPHLVNSQFATPVKKNSIKWVFLSFLRNFSELLFCRTLVTGYLAFSYLAFNKIRNFV